MTSTKQILSWLLEDGNYCQFPGHISPRHLPSPSDGRLSCQTFTSTEKHLREVNTQGLEDYPLSSLIGNDFPHSLSLTSAIDINYDN